MEANRLENERRRQNSRTRRLCSDRRGRRKIAITANNADGKLNVSDHKLNRVEEKSVKYIVVFLRPGSKWNAALPVREQAYWDEHARFMDALFDEGRVILAGPFVDRSGSMVILSVESAEEARAIFREDPWAKQDILVAHDAKEWTIFLDARNKNR